MSFDLYVELGGSSNKNVKDIVDGNYRNIPIADIATRIRLLAGIAAQNEGVKNYAVSGDRKTDSGYKHLVHAKKREYVIYTKELIAKENSRLKSLGLLKPDMPDLQQLPLGSWFLQFRFTLAKPWISGDDDPFYVADSINPVRKDKVFKVPVMAASSWKGLLRWTAMQVRLAGKKDELSDEELAQERFDQNLLFGDEKEEELSERKDFAGYLDYKLKPSACEHYKRKVRKYFDLSSKDSMPHHKGRLMFYPTFFDSIDVEVINPHSRKTKAGTHPIYLECVPDGAEGTFSLLYVPFDLIGREECNEAKIRSQASKDLKRVAEAIQAMMLTYGFSAKRTSGYGAAEDEINGIVRTRAGSKRLTKAKFSELPEVVRNDQF